MKKIVLGTLLFVFVTAVLLALFKGSSTNPFSHHSVKSTAATSPFESTNTNSRYVLVESIVENKSFFFSVEQARFAAPDLIYYNERFFSIFTPGISFFAVPFYMLGKNWNIQELTTFCSTLFFAILNFYLVITLAKKLGANKFAAILAGLCFIFGTNALAYAFTLTQHHGSITILLLAIMNAQSSERTWLNNIFFGVIAGVGLLFDYPNLFLLFPIGLYILNKHFSLLKTGLSYKLTLNPSVLLIIVGLIPLFLVLGWYNKALTGSPFQSGQSMVRSDYFDTAEQQVLHKQMAEQDAQDTFAGKYPFKTRLQSAGMYTLLLSDERSWLYYSPVILLGFMGIWQLYRNSATKGMGLLLLSIVLTNIIVYSMFGDPWGGWSFGSRYLLPAAAILTICTGLVISKYAKNIVFGILFFALFMYSLYINFAGALTTSAIPPKHEAIALQQQIPYTYDYNFEFIEKNQTAAILYTQYLKDYFSLKNYLFILVGCTTLLSIFLYLFAADIKILRRKNEKK